MLKRIRIGDLIKQKKAHSQTGPFGTQLKASDYVEEGVPVINVRNIGFGDIRSNSLEFVDDDMAKELKSHVLKQDDIVFGRKGAVERHSLISSNEEGWIQGSDCIRLRFLTKDYNPTFMSFFFRTEQHKQWMINLGSFGATMGSLNQEIISKIEIPDLHINIQNQIASILSSYDELIENNKQRIKLLEEMAEEIFKEWFVRMRFPGYETAKFFNELDEEVKRGTEGALPEGWKRKRVDEFSSFKMSNAKLTKFNGTKLYLATADISGIDISGEGEIIDWTNKPSRAQLVPELNSVFFARMSNTYKVLVFSKINDDLINTVALTSGFLGLKAKNKHVLPFLFWFVKSSTFHNYKDLYSNGATQVSLTNEGFHMIKLVEPEELIIEKFGEISLPILDEILLLNKKNQLLQQTRDLLLPRLISGKLSVEHLLT
ncbi:MAG: restriction endonuclease subunit S [Paludibacter sp.]